MSEVSTVHSEKQSAAQKDVSTNAKSFATNAGSADAANVQKTQSSVTYSQEEIEKKLAWYARQVYRPTHIAQIQRVVGVSATGIVDEATVLAVASWQKANNLTVDGEFGKASASAAGIKLPIRPDTVSKGETHDENADKVQKGLSDAKYAFTAGGIAGIMGNMEAESGMNPAMEVGVNNGVDGGLCSWHGGRAKNMRNSAPNGDWKNVGHQLDFLYSELTPELKKILTDEAHAEDPRYCAGAFCAIFERPMNYSAEYFKTLGDLIPLSDRSGSVKKSRFALNPYDNRYYIDLQRRFDAAEYYYALYQSDAPVVLKIGEPAKPDSVAPVAPAEEQKNENAKAEEKKEPANTAVVIDVAKAVRVNKQYGYSRAKWKEIQLAIGLVGSDVDGYVGPVTTQKIADWQAANGFQGADVDGMCGSKTLAKLFPDGTPTQTEQNDSKPKSSAPQEPTAKPETAPVDDKEPAKTAVVIDVAKAVRVNKQFGYSRSKWKEIQSAIGLVGSDVDGYVGPVTTQKIADWQAANGFQGADVDGMCGSKTLAKLFPAGTPTQTEQNDSKPKSSDSQESTAKAETTPVDNSEIPTQSEVRSNKSIYGHVDKAGSKLKAATIPYKMYYYGSPTTVRVHEKIVDRVSNIFSQTANAYTPEEIEELGLNKYSGCYNYRPTTNGNSLSMHAWGIAIDIDGANNPMTPTGKEPLASEKAKKFWEIVEANGGVSMGRNFKKDWMHFQFAKFS